jgi:pimeloyl-ACP methyl ester carboxylesterase
VACLWLSDDWRSTQQVHAIFPCRKTAPGNALPPFDCGRGWNSVRQGKVDEWLAVLAGDVKGMTRSHGAPISLVGWSLGGICACGVAKRLPARAGQAITVGTPFAGSPEHNRARARARWVYRLLNGKKTSV